MIIFFKVFGYGLLGWVLLQPIKGVFRVFRRRSTLKKLREVYPVERLRSARGHALVSQSRTLRSPAEFYRVEVDGFRVDIHPSMKTMTYPWTWATVEVHLGYGLPSNLSVMSSSDGPFLQQVLPGARVSSGDSEFDRVHTLKGDQPELTSYLNEARRRSLSALTRVGGSVKGNTLSNSYKHLIFDDKLLL